MKYFHNILETIGNTPLVKLNRITAHIPALVLAKLESFNPGNSIKDRIAVRMIEDAENRGLLSPGGTVVECTSGNTGLGLALVALIKGYRCICTMSDKQSKEKVDILRAMGAEVVLCPSNVKPEDAQSFYSVAERLAKEIPNSFWANQYYNPVNTDAHYESTGKEIWEQTAGKVTHVIAGAGTGGTISGTARYLKERNPKVKIWAIDSYGSALKKFHETGAFDPKEVYPYLTEGVGKDFIPPNVDFKRIDLFEKVTDKDGAIMARRLASEEGILVGYSGGAAFAGLIQLADTLTKDDIVVVICPDHGSRYIAKLFNDDWMAEKGFLEPETQASGPPVPMPLNSSKPYSGFFSNLKKVTESIAKSLG